MERRPAGDLRPLIPVPDGGQGTSGFARTSLVDAAAEIPLGSGGRSAGYAVAVEDVFGVWSAWEDAIYSGPGARAALPRVLALALTSTFAGSAACPAILEVELAVDWADRTPTGVDLAAVFYPMAGPNAVPPGGVDPDLPAPPAASAATSPSRSPAIASGRWVGSPSSASTRPGRSSSRRVPSRARKAGGTASGSRSRPWISGRRRAGASRSGCARRSWRCQA